MFEEVTFEEIAQRMLSEVPEDMDKREGSIIWDALTPAAIEMQNMYLGFDMVLEEAFAASASWEYLVKRAAESGMMPRQAKSAILKAEFNCEVPIGSRFSQEELNYVMIEQIGDYVYKAECETPGRIGNTQFGDLIPIDYIEGLETCMLTELIDPGEDEEDEEVFRERYFARVQRPSTSGNRYDYYNWAMEVPGVGAVKVFPLALGPGTVKLVITDSDRNAASDELTQKVTDYIEELRPIGATVTIISAKEKVINVTANVKLQEGINLGAVQDDFSNLLKGYLKENAFESAYVSIARIGNLLLDVSGLIDYAQLEINDQTGNISLNDEEIAVVGTVSLGVI